MAEPQQAVKPGQVWECIAEATPTDAARRIGSEVTIETEPFMVNSYGVRVEQVRAHWSSGPFEDEPVQWGTHYIRSNFRLISEPDE